MFMILRDAIDDFEHENPSNTASYIPSKLQAALGNQEKKGMCY